MKHINLISLTQAFDALEKEAYKNFLVFYGIKIKDKEIHNLKSLIATWKDTGSIVGIFNQFYVGYTILQIAKEFDLLQFGKDCVINIELKSSSTEDKILQQLKRNKYYLSFLKKEVHSYTFVDDELKKLYRLDDDALKEVDVQTLVDRLSQQKVINIDEIDKLFNPSDYLVDLSQNLQK